MDQLSLLALMYNPFDKAPRLNLTELEKMENNTNIKEDLDGTIDFVGNR